MPTTTSPEWYVLRARANQDARAETNLPSWDVEPFVPRVRKHRHLMGNVVESVGLLFSSSMCARFSASEPLVKARRTRGVQSVVGAASSYRSLSL